MTKLQAFRCPVELAEILEKRVGGKTKTQLIVEALRESLLYNSGANVGVKNKNAVNPGKNSHGAFVESL